MSSEIWETKKNFCDLKSTFNAVNFFLSCKNEIMVSLFNTIFCNTTIYFYAVQAFGSIKILLTQSGRTRIWRSLSINFRCLSDG